MNFELLFFALRFDLCVNNFMETIIFFPLRLLTFSIGLFFYWMEVASDWIIGARGKTEYLRVGSCRRCGRCCRHLALEMPALLSRSDWFASLLSLLHRLLFNFQYEGKLDKWLVYRCGYFRDDPHPGCRIYRFRHRLCRFYPYQRLYGHPKTHPECGFKFLRRDGRPTFDDVLDEKIRSGSSV